MPTFPFGPTNINDFARGQAGALFIGANGSGRVRIDRYEDTFPEVLSGVGIDVEESTEDLPNFITRPGNISSLSIDPSGILNLIYFFANGVVWEIRHAQSRDSADTLEASTTLFSGTYTRVRHVYDRKHKRLVAMLYKADTTNAGLPPPNREWHVTVGTLQAAGTLYDWSTPQLVLSDAFDSPAASDYGSMGSLCIRKDGEVTFSYHRDDTSVQLAIGAGLNDSGTAAWTFSEIAAAGAGYSHVCHCHDEGRGRVVALLLKAPTSTGGDWYVAVGTPSGAGYTWTTPVLVPELHGSFGNSGLHGSILRRTDGLLEAIIANGTTTISALCRDLQADGTGTWTART